MTEDLPRLRIVLVSLACLGAIVALGMVQVGHVGDAMMIAGSLAVIGIGWYALAGHYLLGAVVGRWVRMLHGGNYDSGGMLERTARRLREKGKSEEAAAKCREWLRHERDRAAPILLLCEILDQDRRDTAQAIRELEVSVMRPFPAEEHVVLALRLAELYRRVGRQVEIELVFRRVRSFHPASPAIMRLKV